MHSRQHDGSHSGNNLRQTALERRPPAVPSIRIREQGRLLRQIKTGVTCFRQPQSHVLLSSKTVICCVQQPRLHSPDPPSGKSSLEQSSNSDTTNGNGVSDQRSQPSVDIAGKRELQDGPAPQTARSWSLSDHMVNLAQDPEVLQLFFPYLPKNQRSMSGLTKALTIPGFQNQLLKGEAQHHLANKMQIGNSELVYRLREAAPDREQFNEQLQKLGFYSLLD